ncbi:hypothetical protein AB0M46_05745 [Dactylosporangium sp. NPDC051485]|uniref:hypothetical protein n=1 Tax=Dactylosporangium sp. NPDC051485 TaxID=3154846 RepID=UPI00341F7141
MTNATLQPTAPGSSESNRQVVDRVRYSRTLDDVESRLDQVHQLLHRSRRAPAGDRARRLVELHAAIRAAGQLLNDAQGGWPPPPPEDDAA